MVFGKRSPVTREVIGSVSVDSGTVIITDPCYVDEGFSYDEMHKKWGDFKQTHIKGPEDLGVVVQTAWGDGSYPVIAEIQGDRIVRIIVEFDDFGDDEEDEEVY